MKKISKEDLLLVINHSEKFNKDEYDYVDLEDLLYVYGDDYGIRGELTCKSESMKILRERLKGED